MAKRSRLSKNFERKSKRTLVLSILGIIVVLFILLRFGLPLISDVSFFTGRLIPNKEKTNAETKKVDSYVPPPSIDSIPKATNKPELKVTGTALAGQTIQLYLNGNKADQTKVDENANYEFNINLTEGENIIKTKATSGTYESDFSDSLTIDYKKKASDITIDNPKDGDKISHPNPYNITGTAEADSTITVNGFQAIISGTSYSYLLTLKDGDNEIKVQATDVAGNKTEKIIHINYSQ